MDDLLGGRTCVRSVLILIALAVVVDSAIYIHESAVPSFRRRLQKLDISTARQLLHRRRRSSTTGNNDNGTVLAQEVGLRGTERHTHAYVHWSGKLKSEVYFGLSLYPDLLQIRASYKENINSVIQLSGDKLKSKVRFTCTVVAYIYIGIYFRLKKKKQSYIMLYCDTKEAITNTIY